MKQHRVWDLPIRIFHWLLVAGMIAVYISGKLGGGLIDWHGRIGLFLLGLIVFRLVWGVIGSPTARFSHFVRGPGAIRAYLKGEWRGVGHNPLGALSVLGLLGLTAAQASTGLFANDDIAFQGPLADLVGKDWSNYLSAWHQSLIWGLLALVALHLLAIIYYQRVKGENLIKPMITGWQESDAPAPAPADPVPPRRGAGLLAFLVAVAVASTTVYAAAGGLLPAPAPAAPPASASPGW